MANPARAKGTAWEVELLARLRALFGLSVERAPLKGIQDHGDFVNVPILIEAKSTIKPLFQEWARKAESKAGSGWWVVWHGDRRTKSGTGPYVLMPLELAEQLVLHGFENPEAA